MMSRRFFHMSKMMSTSAQTSSLAKLRKSTGYSMSNCKKALELHSDLSLAEKWLHEEAKRQGWSKIANLEHRTAAQGLIGICIKDSMAAMVEVNCETDFVARNAEFQSFVAKVLSSCLNHTVEHMLSANCTKLFLDSNQLNSLPSNSSTLGDLAASAIGKFGEKTVIRRAVCFKTEKSIILSSFAHPSTSCPDLQGASLGKYGGLIAFEPKMIDTVMNKEYLSNLGHKLSQHIVGMNPITLGNLKDIKPVLKSPAEMDEEEFMGKIVHPDQRKEDIILNKNLSVLKTPQEMDEDEWRGIADFPDQRKKDIYLNKNSSVLKTPAEIDEEEISGKIVHPDQRKEDIILNENLANVEESTDDQAEDEKLIDTNESRLFHQQFLLDPDMSVGEFVLKHSLEVVDFHRFECGEVIE